MEEEVETSFSWLRENLKTKKEKEILIDLSTIQLISLSKLWSTNSWIIFTLFLYLFFCNPSCGQLCNQCNFLLKLAIFGKETTVYFFVFDKQTFITIKLCYIYLCTYDSIILFFFWYYLDEDSFMQIITNLKINLILFSFINWQNL